MVFVSLKGLVASASGGILHLPSRPLLASLRFQRGIAEHVANPFRQRAFELATDAYESIRIDPRDLNRARVDRAVRLAFVGPVMLQLCIADKLPDALTNSA